MDELYCQNCNFVFDCKWKWLAISQIKSFKLFFSIYDQFLQEFSGRSQKLECVDYRGTLLYTYESAYISIKRLSFTPAERICASVHQIQSYSPNVHPCFCTHVLKHFCVHIQYTCACVPKDCQLCRK